MPPFRGWLITAVDDSDAGVASAAVLPVLSWTEVAVVGAVLSADGDV